MQLEEHDISTYFNVPDPHPLKSCKPEPEEKGHEYSDQKNIDPKRKTPVRPLLQFVIVIDNAKNEGYEEYRRDAHKMSMCKTLFKRIGGTEG
ncbi:MAG: hypothetical protein V3R82_00560 [Candidatus Hydrothermarchaeales archaeon]